MFAAQTRDLSHIELARSDNISSSSKARTYRVNLSWTYFTKVNISTERKTRARIRGENPSILALSVCVGVPRSEVWALGVHVYGFGLSPYMHLTRQMRCLHFCQSVNSPLRISPYTASAFFIRSQAPSVTFGDSSLTEGANLRKKRHYFHSTSFFIFGITVFSEEILRIVFRYLTRRRR